MLLEVVISLDRLCTAALLITGFVKVTPHGLGALPVVSNLDHEYIIWVMKFRRTWPIASLRQLVHQTVMKRHFICEISYCERYSCSYITVDITVWGCWIMKAGHDIRHDIMIFI